MDNDISSEAAASGIDADLTVVVSSVLWGDPNTLIQRSRFLSSPRQTSVSQVADFVVSPVKPIERIRLLSRKERQDLISRCQDLRKKVKSNANPGKRDVYVSEYRRMKQEVRNSCALRIQSTYRGYRVRKPLSLGLSHYRYNRIPFTLERIHTERRQHGRPTNVHEMTYEQLKAEKQAIKLILIGFDRTFKQKHNRMPNKQEKEKFRPIYNIYNTVKKLLQSHPRRRKEKEAKASARGDGDRKGQQPQPQNAKAQPSELDTVKKEKRALQVKLNKFEQSFRSRNGRPIMWESDIAPVKQDYERYKALKKEIARLTAKSKAEVVGPRL